MKIVIRNTSRDKTTAAARKARPGDVQPYPTIRKVRLPPGGSLNADSTELSSSDIHLLVTLAGCGCVRVFSRPGYGPMREISADELLSMLPAEPAPKVSKPVAAPEPVVPEPEPVAEPEVVAEPVAESGPIVAESVAEPEETPVEEPVDETPAYLEGELKAMKNAVLRDILNDMGFDQSSGMKKADLVAKILEIQES